MSWADNKETSNIIKSMRCLFHELQSFFFFTLTTVHILLKLSKLRKTSQHNKFSSKWWREHQTHLWLLNFLHKTRKWETKKYCYYKLEKFSLLSLMSANCSQDTTFIRCLSKILYCTWRVWRSHHLKNWGRILDNNYYLFRFRSTAIFQHFQVSWKLSSIIILHLSYLKSCRFTDTSFSLALTRRWDLLC